MRAHELDFVVMLGSLRRGSFHRAIAQTLDELAPDDVAVTVLPTYGEFPHYSRDLEGVLMPATVISMGAAIASADAIVFVTPEYNRSLPGALKNALDWLGRLPSKPLDRKPAAIQTASNGLLGGVRAQSALREVLASMNAFVLNIPDVVVPHVAAKIDQDAGALRDEATRRAIAEQLRALADLARSTRTAAWPVERWAPAAVNPASAVSR